MKFIFSTQKLEYARSLFKQGMKLSRTTLLFSRPMSVQASFLTIHETTIKSCGSLYEKWRETGRFGKLPNSDLTFQVKYLDTLQGLDLPISNLSSVPVVVGLHGAPGSCNEFSNLAEFLHNKGVRFVSPTFPDFSSFRPGIFKHTDEEKAQYVRDFLSAISVPKVDLLVCHSSAVYPGLLLCLHQNPAIKSLAMLNPSTFSLKMPAINYYQGLKQMVKASESPVFLKIMETICPIILKLAKIPVRVDKFLDPLLSATVMARTNIPESKEKFHKLASSGFPIFYAFSEDDKLIGGQNASELATLLGAQFSDICYINKHGVIEKKGQETSRLKVMSFENGSHYVFWKYSDIINAAVYNFLIQHITDSVQS
ncbi:uncharacterized protein [Parasteatoda tepidariorum]|uniref:uncharacterized protein isoform X1 n=1 Tax=Parasteatoda tepidariorum TaxID=114398 RepID=UPI001C719179|nr:uncharacterized protein LOC107438608 isoform X1 [Parasteatoda tepidariorum]